MQDTTVGSSSMTESPSRGRTAQVFKRTPDFVLTRYGKTHKQSMPNNCHEKSVYTHSSLKTGGPARLAGVSTGVSQETGSEEKM